VDAQGPDALVRDQIAFSDSINLYQSLPESGGLWCKSGGSKRGFPPSHAGDVWAVASGRDGPVAAALVVQGYLAHEKPRPLRTLQKDYS